MNAPFGWLSALPAALLCKSLQLVQSPKGPAPLLGPISLRLLDTPFVRPLQVIVSAIRVVFCCFSFFLLFLFCSFCFCMVFHFCFFFFFLLSLANGFCFMLDSMDFYVTAFWFRLHLRQSLFLLGSLPSSLPLLRHGDVHFLPLISWLSPSLLLLHWIKITYYTKKKIDVS